MRWIILTLLVLLPATALALRKEPRPKDRSPVTVELQATKIDCDCDKSDLRHDLRQRRLAMGRCLKGQAGETSVLIEFDKRGRVKRTRAKDGFDEDGMRCVERQLEQLEVRREKGDKEPCDVRVRVRAFKR